MQFSDVLQIVLTPLEIGVLAVFCIYWARTGRPQWPMGLYLSAYLWTRPIIVGGISITWVLLATILAGTWVYFHKMRRLSLAPRDLAHSTELWLPPTGRWVVALLLCWSLWIYIVAYIHNTGTEELFRVAILYILIPMGLVWLFASDLRRLQGFAWAYVVMTLIACWKAIEALGLTLDYLITDPALSNTPFLRLGLHNYNHFSHMLGIGLILAVTLFFCTRKILPNVLLLASAGIFAYFILLAGARQTMSGAVIVLAVIVLWALRQSGMVASKALLVTYVALFVGFSVYQLAPSLVVRADEGDVSRSFNVVSDRSEYWQIALGQWQESPVWGTGFYQSGYAHNLFIGALADQGAVGLLFFLGYLLFALQQGLSILRREGSPDGRVWRIGLFGVMLFGMIHGQASGSVLVTAHIYWPIIMLWVLNWYDRADAPALPEPPPAPTMTLPLATRWVTKRRISANTQ